VRTLVEGFGRRVVCADQCLAQPVNGVGQRGGHQVRVDVSRRAQLAVRAQFQQAGLLAAISAPWSRAVQPGNKILACCKGGNAAAAQNIAPELSDRLHCNRGALAAREMEAVGPRAVGWRWRHS
jgi:hypothetical protein